MKVMQINCVYKQGSTGKIVHDIHKSLQEYDITSIVCYGRGELIKEDNVYKTSSELLAKFNNIKSKFTGMPYNGSFFATKNLLKIIERESPDVVHLHCINGFFVNIYRLLAFLKENKIPTVLTLHAEFMHTGSCGHSYECEKWKTGCGNCPHLRDATKAYFFDRTAKNWRLMKEAFSGFDKLVITSVSPWLQHRAEQSPIMSGFKHCTVLNGIDCDIFRPRNFVDIKRKHGIGNEKVAIHVTANFSSSVKGGNYVIELAKQLNNIKFIVIGSRETDLNLPQNIINVGRVADGVELAEYYSAADVCIITGKKETFSMPVAESLCCGTPVVGFLAGGPESITIPEYSEFVEYGNMEELKRAVVDMINLSINKIVVSKSAKRIYNRKQMTNNYLKLYNEVLGNDANNA